MKKLKYFIPILFVLFFAIYLLYKPQVIVSKFDLPIANSYTDLITQSEVVVKGHFTKFSHEWNMARDIDDNPSDIYETIGRVYNFEITHIYKGLAKNVSNIQVNQRYSETIYYTAHNDIPDMADINKNTPKVIALDQTYIEPDLNKEYILFLNSEPTQHNYYGAVYPFMVSITNNELKLESQLMNTNGTIEKEYKVNSKNIIIRSEYGRINDFSNEMNFNQFENLFH